MKRIPAIVALISVFSVLPSYARADDAAAVTKLAHEFVVDVFCMDFDKMAALGRPGDAETMPKPSDEFQLQLRDAAALPEIQDLRRQLAEEAGKAISLGTPEFTPDNSCAIVTATPVEAESRKFAELTELYKTYMTTAYYNKAQGLPAPKIAEIRALILTPGSPELQEIIDHAASFPAQKVRLQFEKTAAGWRVNLHALDSNPPGTP